MDFEKIKGLLQKYWDCQTTLEEEKELRDYFRHHNPEALKETAPLFQYFNEQSGKNLTDTAFDTKVIKHLRRPAGQARSIFYNAMRIAAGIIVVVMAVWLVRMEVREMTPAEVTDTYDDPKMAFEETKKALMMISRSFSTAEEQARKINLFNEAQKDLPKAETTKEL